MCSLLMRCSGRKIDRRCVTRVSVKLSSAYRIQKAEETGRILAPDSHIALLAAATDG